MLTYILRRLIGAIPTLLLLAVLTFFALRLAPGGPFDGDKVFPPEVMESIKKNYLMDRPVAFQFAHWLGRASQGDFGESLVYLNRPVMDMIAESLPVSLKLGFWALLLAIAVGVPLGAVSAWKRNTFWDTSAMFLAVSGVSLPIFLMAGLLILVFSTWLDILPPALWEGPEYMILPVLALSFQPIALVARLVRATMIEAFQSDYIRTAYGKGLEDSRVVFKHALRNSLIPVLTFLGPLAANLVTGSFLVEHIFQIPGMGNHFVSAFLNRDYSLVMGVTMIYGGILILANLLVDLCYAWADPRIRLS